MARSALYKTGTQYIQQLFYEMLDKEIFKMAKMTFKRTSRSLVIALFDRAHYDILLVINWHYVSIFRRFRDTNTCLAYVTNCDLQQSFNSITTLKIQPTYDFLFVRKRVVANIRYFMR